MEHSIARSMRELSLFPEVVETDLWAYETVARARGAQRIAGVDEAGRGPLAGPVVAAAVVLDPASPPEGLADSKQLTPAAREAAFQQIYQQARGVGVGVVDVAVIDRVNILQAALQAMREALAALPEPPDWVLVDGNQPLPRLSLPQTTIIHGDARSASVAAASIVAKVTRDHIMVQLDALFPGYGLAQHKGYPTPDHLARLAELGVSRLHRRSFAPVRKVLEGRKAS
jgi:ribonuclease HII